MSNVTNFKSYCKEIEKDVKRYIHCSNNNQKNFFMKHKITTGILVIILIVSIDSLSYRNKIRVSSTNSAINILSPAVNKKKLTIASPNASLEHGIVKSDIYVATKTFHLKDNKVIRNIYFENTAAKVRFKMDNKSSVSGKQQIN